MIILPSGTGETLGDTMVLAEPLQISGNIWFVNFTTGTDSAAPAGTDREKPLKTLAQAHTNAANGDIIVLEAGHSETLTTVQTITKQLCIWGGGSAAGVPTVTFTMNAANQNTFGITSPGVEIRNIKFAESSVANVGAGSSGKVVTDQASLHLVGCYFSMGATDQLPGLRGMTGANNLWIENCTFVSTATTTATRPTHGILFQAGLTDAYLRGVTLDDGTVGFTTGAFVATGTASTRFRAEALSLLRGADFSIHSGSTFWIHPATTTGGARIITV